ncbi:MAG TPA: NAD(P)/FAD-dependent oxidoreductase [Acidimicrobiales bacterium]|nr:NAD(P)/FAD-dependent oxidoreductase [Acidimicrobiales bacterium]
MPIGGLHDVVVIGAGAAGVSAAIECLDIKLDVVLLEAAGEVGGQIEEIPHEVRNVAPAMDGNDALVEALGRHASTLGDRLGLDERVTRLDLAAGVVEAGTHRYRARSVVVATGSRRRELSDAPEGSFGGSVTYLVEPHLERFAGRPVAVIGGGDSALLDALELAGTGSQVTLVHRSPRLTARRDVVDRVRSESRITVMARWALGSLAGSDQLDGVELSNLDTGEQRRLDVAGVVLKLGREPGVDLVRDQVALGPRGGIVVDAELRTSDPRTFAAGDVVEGAYERVATAVGQGSLVARSILWYLESHP